MCLTAERSEGSSIILIIFDIDLPFKTNLSKQTDSEKDQSFRGVWNLHLAAHSQ